MNRVLCLILTVLAILCRAISSSAETNVCANGDSEECTNNYYNDKEIEDNINNDDDEHCIDENDNCKQWAAVGECDANLGYMTVSCRRSCKVCHAKFGDDADFGVRQFIPPHVAPFVKKIIADSDDYIQNIVRVDPKYREVVDECINNHPSCSEWALGTGCDDNPKYMKMECSPACQSCDYILEKKLECAPKEGTEDDAIQNGGMNALFERMVRLANDNNWQPKVLSRPAKKAIDEDGSSEAVPTCEDDVTNPCNTHDGPWVITLENFISDEEIKVLLDWGAKIGYERSQAGDEVVEARTSSHAWCTIEEGCYDDPIVKSLRERIAFVTGVSEENYECLQLLKYVEGTYYKPHNDFIVKHVEQKHGPRLLTFFIYFNEVSKGGGTRFNRINWPQGLTVEPKPGRVLIWPSCLDHDLYKEDKRTEHEAMKVEEGEKYSANAWIHMRDFQTPFLAGCPS